MFSIDSSQAARILGARITRRCALLLAGLSSLPLGHAVDTTLARKKRKSKVCLDGQTIKIPKKKKKKFMRKGARPSACRSCSASSECGSGAICSEGVCHKCSVACNGDSLTCGAALSQRLSQGGSIYVCPGRYGGSFTAGTGIIAGAGSGDDPATSTILDGRDENLVLLVEDGATLRLSGLRITRGLAASVGGGGIQARKGDLSISDCAIVSNRATDGAGGIMSLGSRLTVSRTLIQGNSGPTGGGIMMFGPVAGSVSDSRIIENHAVAPAGVGGGLYLENTPFSISGTEIRGNTASLKGGGIAVALQSLSLDASTTITGNTASMIGAGGGISIDSATVNLNGATVSGNAPDNINPPL